MQDGLNKLAQIEQALRKYDDGELYELKLHLIALANEAYAEMKESWYTVRVTIHEPHDRHIPTYRNRAKQLRSCVLVDIAELSHLLSKKRIEKHRCFILLQRLIEGRLYLNQLEAKIERFGITRETAKTNKKILKM
ncbi:hypothetical protein CR205_11195 [Alteribacter lacisalsi]|uniref:Uncharacterized protein n=1 Tax=Alteribacter lacisalsi TaxID=2045244 RepID=A0A2W0HPQ8_9BACI|nr:hypothetical protein [Alteribacter lacisalsi]PYZ99092.1 hypothetical protein CR205_11195 [Alteribacter lacisalsi]